MQRRGGSYPPDMPAGADLCDECDEELCSTCGACHDCDEPEECGEDAPSDDRWYAIGVATCIVLPGVGLLGASSAWLGAPSYVDWGVLLAIWGTTIAIRPRLSLWLHLGFSRPVWPRLWRGLSAGMLYVGSGYVAASACGIETEHGWCVRWIHILLGWTVTMTLNFIPRRGFDRSAWRRRFEADHGGASSDA